MHVVSIKYALLHVCIFCSFRPTGKCWIYLWDNCCNPLSSSNFHSSDWPFLSHWRKHCTVKRFFLRKNAKPFFSLPVNSQPVESQQKTWKQHEKQEKAREVGSEKKKKKSAREAETAYSTLETIFSKKKKGPVVRSYKGKSAKKARMGDLIDGND